MFSRIHKNCTPRVWHVAAAALFLCSFLFTLITQIAVCKLYSSYPAETKFIHSPPPSLEAPYTADYRNVSFLTEATDGQWKPVDLDRFNRFFVYSAYLDDRWNTSFIRIIGTAKTKANHKVICVMHYSETEEKEYLDGEVQAINEHWNLEYSAVFVICKLKNSTILPESVTILLDKKYPEDTTIENRLLILNKNHSTEYKSKYDLSVCVKPVHYYFDKVAEFTEFIELNKLMGVTHFTLYESSIGPSVKCVIEEYVKEGTVTVLPWTFFMYESKIEIRTEGMFAALNDCLYRNMYRHPFIVFIDFDEYIIPQANQTLTSLLKYIDEMVPKHVSAYIFQNAFFYLEWEDDEDTTPDDPVEGKLLTVTKTRRKKKLHTHKQRSKYIVKSKDVVEVGNHFVWQFIKEHRAEFINPDVGMLHHYRICEFGGKECIKTESVVDKSAHRYKGNLTCNVSKRWIATGHCNTPSIENDVQYCWA